MAGERYSVVNELTALGFLVNALESRGTDDGDTGCSFPRTDAEDLSRGARFIPGEVTMARRGGEKVNFITTCSLNCWYWEMPDGSRIYHFDPETYHQIGIANGRKVVKDKFGYECFKEGAGPCPKCGNVNTNGGTITP